MAAAEVDELVKQLATGFDILQDEYQQLFAQHQALERKLATAREQYNELAKLCGTTTVTTPPLSLSSSPNRRHEKMHTTTHSVASMLEENESGNGTEAAGKVRAAVKAADQLKQGLPSRLAQTPNNVKIWSGPSADISRTSMPSISESPLEQDFTIEGIPSKLGCPFATMSKKKLSTHAESVLSRYRTQNSAVIESGAQSSASSVNRVNGRESFASRNRRQSSGLVDPIKAEICGLSDHDDESPFSERAHMNKQDNCATNADAAAEEVGVCPIRFLDQHSPEEVATYFEKHKHELPRSHEVCVKRYQSNEKQIRELDEKYGNLVSMIQGLGAKHKELLPEEPGEGEDETDAEAAAEAKKAEKVTQWASSVSAQAPDDGRSETGVKGGEDERKSHFERPLREIRVGESPSRPWGIHVPADFVQKEASDTSSRPAEREQPLRSGERPTSLQHHGKSTPQQAKQCPFGFNKAEIKAVTMNPEATKSQPPQSFHGPAFVDKEQTRVHTSAATSSAAKENKMVFTGPVFVGYSVEDAAKILRESGLGTK